MKLPPLKRTTITSSVIVTAAGIVAITVMFAGYAWSRRWISDDGLIFVRIARQILDGHGPVFNVFERAEANTSALWPWLIALVGAITGGDLGRVAVFTGLAFSVAGVAIAMDGTRRWHRVRGSQAMLVPAGALVVTAVFPFWDYATSGLESGLTTLWLACAWWCFVTVMPDARRRRHVATAVVLGLGTLVRPDLAIVSATFLVAWWLTWRPPWRRTLAFAAIAGALPIGFEVFRAGFYGTLVPLPALAKGATGAEWSRGVSYFVDFMRPFVLWLPFAALAGLLGFFVWRRGIARRDRVIVVAPIVAAAVMALYVTRVGGDFMFARMLLPATFVLALPAMLLPLRRCSAPALAIIGAWAVYIARTTNDHRSHVTHDMINDERRGYVIFTHDLHPVDDESYILAASSIAVPVIDAVHDHRRLFISEGGTIVPLDPARPQSVVFVAGRLGLGGAITPIDGITADTLGLANPLGARITITRPDEGQGHQKELPWPWLVADFGDPQRDADTEFSPSTIRAARHAMSCGAIAELLESARAPLTLGRFMSNLAGSVGRTRLVIPSDPADAELEFCGATLVPRVVASTACEDYGWSKAYAIDGVTRTMVGHRLGFSTAVWIMEPHLEWLDLDLRARRTITELVLYPRDDPGFVGAGFPIDFTIQIWDGEHWIDRASRHDVPPPPDAPQIISLGGAVTTDRVRIFATKLQNVRGDGYVMQFAEVEAR